VLPVQTQFKLLSAALRRVGETCVSTFCVAYGTIVFLAAVGSSKTTTGSGGLGRELTVFCGQDIFKIALSPLLTYGSGLRMTNRGSLTQSLPRARFAGPPPTPAYDPPFRVVGQFPVMRRVEDAVDANRDLAQNRDRFGYMEAQMRQNRYARKMLKILAQRETLFGRS